jgi:ABC-type sugar transport system substrate-binding protein
MKSRSVLVLILVALFVTLSISASVSAQDDGQLRIGLVQLGTDNPFWIAQVAGGNEAARRNNFELIVTSGEGDVTKQVEAFENLVNQGVDAISINPLDASAFGPAMEQAAAAGIPVVCLFSHMDGCVSTLGIEEVENGRMVGRYAVQLLTEKYGEPRGNIAILLGALGQAINDNRAGGFNEIISQYPNITVVAQESTGNWEADKAVSLTENWLTAFPDLDLIYGLSDSLTVPASDVLRRAGREDIMLVSYDGTDVGLAGVADGSLKSTVALLPQYNGFWNVYAAYLVASGIQFPETYLMPGAMVTTDNLAGFQQLAVDQADNITSFPFELPMPLIVDEYAQRFAPEATPAS